MILIRCSKLVIIVIAISAFSLPVFADYLPQQVCQDIVDKIDKINDSLSLDYFNHDYQLPKWDANEYFNILQHINMEDKYSLKWLYYYDGMGGFPILYYSNKDVDVSDNENIQQEIIESPFEHNYNYSNYLLLDGSDLSYFEFSVLEVIGGQFCLFWHAIENDNIIICTQEKLEEILLGVGTFREQPLPEDIAIKAREIDINPLIERNEDKVIISLVVFTSWGGFYRESFTIPTTDKYSNITREKEELVYYSCGVRF